MAEPVVFAVGADLSSLKKELSKVGPIANKTGELAGQALKAGFGAVMGAAGATGLFAKGVLEEGAQFETLSTRLTTLMGSAEDARDRMQELANIGKTTPFELPGIVEAEASLRGFGVDAENVLPKVLDLSAALGLELSDAAGAVGRAFAGGAGAADVLRERGVLAAIELRTGIKATNMEIGQFREELLTTLEEYEGGSARLAATLNGQVSNLKDSWGDFQRQVADAGFYEASKTAVTEINRLLIENEEAVAAIAQETGRWLKGSLMFVVQTMGDLVNTWNEVKLAAVSLEGIIYGLDALTADWGATALNIAADIWGIQGDFQDGLRASADANAKQAEVSRGKMGLLRKEADDIKADIAGVDAETEAILKRIGESGTGGTTTRKKTPGPASEDPEVVALKERQDLIDSILQQYRDEEAEEAAQAWEAATKLREQQYKDWEDAEQDAADERLRIARETEARRAQIAQTGVGIMQSIVEDGTRMRLQEGATMGEILKAQSMALFGELLSQLSVYMATRSVAAFATGNIPRGAAFAVGAGIAAAGATAMGVAASNQTSGSSSAAEGDSETFTQGSRREVAATEAGDTDGGLAQAADALVEAAEELKAAARALARGSGGGSLSRTLQRERSISGLFSSFQGA